jgi:RimJ/RimL family protein N-acetyltransferase
MIESDRLILRTFKEKDIDECLELTAKLKDIGEFWPTNLWTEQKLCEEYQKSGYWTDTWGSMLITDKQDKMMGEINYFSGGLLPVTGYEIGYRIYRPEERRKGYISEILPLFVSYMFGLKPINRLQLCCDPQNIGSKIIAEKCGFKFEGIIRESFFTRGKFCDNEMYSMLRSEWEAL